MTSLLSPRRPEPDIALQTAVRGPADVPSSGAPEQEGGWIGWLPIAVAGAVVAALAGWILVAGLTVVGWLAADPGTLDQALHVGTQLWLLANGAGARLDDVTLTLVPWGVTALFAFMLSRVAAMAVRKSEAGARPGPSAIAGVVTGAYVVPVVVVSVISGSVWASVPRWASIVAVLWLAAAWGAGRAANEPLTRRWPRWVSAVPQAVVSAHLTLFAVGAAVLVVGLISHLDRIQALIKSLDAGVAGNLALLLLQLAYAPNAIVWGASYALGSGFTLGSGSVVAPAATQLGLLPGLPLLGAMPTGGPGGLGQLCWLGGGVLAGAAAALVVVRNRPRARFDETSLVGGLAGALAGAAFVVVGWASGGSLGTLRMAGLGPRLYLLLIMATTLLGLSGCVVGLVSGVLRVPEASVGSAAEDGAAEEVAAAGPVDEPGCAGSEPTVVLVGPRTPTSAADVQPASLPIGDGGPATGH